MPFSLKSNQEPEAAPSLYQAICGAIQSDGTLPRDFSLPRPERADAAQKLHFADGALDGINLYHMAPDKRDIKSLTEIVGLISARSYDKAAECLQLFFSMDEYVTMLPLIDDLQAWIIAHKEQVNAGALYEFSLRMLKESAHVESVKFCLSCLELLNTGTDAQIRNLVKVFALSDEFTLYCLFIMRTWPDSSDAIFDAAQHVFGWGRIHAAEQLAPSNGEMRRWLLLEGWNNNVMAEYSALTCLEKSGLAKKLRTGALDDAEFTAAGKLLPPLLSEGPVAGISALENADAFLSDYLAQAEARAAALSDFEAVLAVREYYAGQNPPDAALIAHCGALLARPACRAAAEAAVAEGRGFAFAKKLGVPYQERVLALLEEDFLKNYNLAVYVMEDAHTVDQAISLAESNLSLEKISTGPQEETGLGQAFTRERALGYIVQFLRPFPGKGETLLAAALLCPVIHCRNMALNVLEDWKAAGFAAGGAVQSALEQLKTSEVNGDIKKRLSKF